MSPRERMASHEREITEPTRLSEHGRLRREAVGWSRRPLLDARIDGRWGRRKRWEYWCVITREVALQITIADLDYVGLCEVSCVELGALRTELHLCFGRWRGTVHAHGAPLRVEGALGWAEEHRARW